jgi:thioester reductase-like protein
LKKYVLFTGATGFIGRYLLRQMLLNDVPVAVIARASDNRGANERIREIVAGFEKEEGRALPKPKCFTGNISEEMLGVDDFALDWFEENCNAVFHNAASIRFHAPEGDKSRDPYLSNVGGTSNVVELCNVAQIKDLHYVSTAYVSGDRSDVCKESELDVGQGVHNDYQASKILAEKVVHESEGFNTKTIYRPGLVVGDSTTGYTTHPDFGLYHYIEFLAMIIPSIRAADATIGTLPLSIRLRFTGQERRNIVTIDWVAAMMFHIFSNPELHNKTYHLTPDDPCRSEEIVDALGKYFDFEGVEYVGHGEIPQEGRSELESMFYDYVEQFEVFWGDEPTFDRSNTDAIAGDFPTPKIDADCLARLIRFAVEECFLPKANEAGAA